MGGKPDEADLATSPAAKLRAICQECGQITWLPPLEPPTDPEAILDYAPRFFCGHCRALLNESPADYRLPVLVDEEVEEISSPPAGFHVEHWGPDLIVNFRWRTEASWIPLALAIGFCLMVAGVFWYNASRPWDLIGALGGAAAGVLLIYIALLARFNRTHIRWVGDLLTSRSGPLPTPADRFDIVAEDIQSFYVTRNIPTIAPDESEVITYSVRVMFTDGRSTELREFDDLPSACFLQQTLSNHLQATAKEEAKP